MAAALALRLGTPVQRREIGSTYGGGCLGNPSGPGTTAPPWVASQDTDVRRQGALPCGLDTHRDVPREAQCRPAPEPHRRVRSSAGALSGTRQGRPGSRAEPSEDCRALGDQPAPDAWWTPSSRFTPSGVVALTGRQYALSLPAPRPRSTPAPRRPSAEAPRCLRYPVAASPPRKHWRKHWRRHS
jgi:hypothetical protein